MAEERQHIDEKEMQRYLSGDMSPEEQHAFEVKLENDAFAYEAIEGLSSQKESPLKESLSQLQLNKEQEPPSQPWFRIAATVSILVLAGIAIWYYSEQSFTGELAYEETADLPDSGRPERLLDEISPTVIDNAIIEGQPDQMAQNDQAVSDEVQGAIEREEIHIAEATSKKVESEDMALNNEILESLDEDIEVSETQILEETVVAMDVPITETVEQPTFSQSATAARSMSRSSLNANTPRPIIGGGDYQRYLRDSLRYDDIMGAGIVTLRFTINDQGRPQKIQVIRSLNEQADKEAIRLIEQGPDWKGTAGMPTTLSIPIKPE